jgi:parvulin-like peptidyl-prolyl isomerase
MIAGGLLMFDLNNSDIISYQIFKMKKDQVMKNFLGTTALMLSLSATSLMATDALASVNGKQITESDAEIYIAQTQPGAHFATLPSDQKGLIVDRLVERLLFVEQAKKEGIEKDSNYVRLLERDKEELMVRTWITKQFENTVVSDGEAKKYFTDHPDEFKIPAQVHARHILLKEEKDANSVIAKLKGLKGEALQKKFIELAKAKSTGPTGPKGGDLGFFGSGQMVKPFNEAVFAMKKGEVTMKPVKTQFGYHVIYVEETKPAKAVPYEEAKSRIINMLKQKAFSTKMAKLVDTLKSKAKIVKNSEGNETK